MASLIIVLTASVPDVRLADAPTSAPASPSLTNSLGLDLSSTAPPDSTNRRPPLDLNLFAFIETSRSASDRIERSAMHAHQPVTAVTTEGTKATKGGKIGFVNAGACQSGLPDSPTLIPLSMPSPGASEFVPVHQMMTRLPSPLSSAGRLARGCPVPPPAPRLQPKELPPLARHQLEHQPQRGRSPFCHARGPQ